MDVLGIFKKKDEEQEPEYIESPLRTPMLNYRVYVMSRTESLTTRAAVFAAGGVAGLIFYGGLFKDDGKPTILTTIANLVVFALVGFVAAKAFVPMLVDARKEKRQVELSHQFRDMLDALASSFSTGANVTMAFRSALTDMERQYSDDAYIVKELSEIVVAEQQGFPIEDMLHSFAERSGNEDIESFANVFGIFSRKGGSMKAIVQRMRGILVEKSDIADEIRTKLTSNKIQHNAMSIMPIAIVLILKFMNPAFAENFATPVGVACCTIAIIIFVASYRYGQKIVNVQV